MKHPAFNNIVGQSSVQSLLSLSLFSLENGNNGELCQPFFTGEAGVGKTEIARAYGKNAARLLNCEFREYESPRDFILMDDYSPFIEWVAQTPSFVLYIDEIHELNTSRPAHANFLTFLRKALDRQNTGKVFQVGSNTMMFDRTKQVIILATNHPDKVDNAVKSRMGAQHLSLYNLEDVEEITVRILDAHGLECDSPETLKRIASCGRGTARPIINLVKDVFVNLSIPQITTEHAMMALRMKQMYPSGLNHSEIGILKFLYEKTNGKSDTAISSHQIHAALPDAKSMFSQHIGYLTVKNLINTTSAGRHHITKKGRAYIEICREKGFDL